jgi:hypothetical protein
MWKPDLTHGQRLCAHLKNLLGTRRRPNVVVGNHDKSTMLASGVHAAHFATLTEHCQKLLVRRMDVDIAHKQRARGVFSHGVLRRRAAGHTGSGPGGKAGGRGCCGEGNGPGGGGRGAERAQGDIAPVALLLPEVITATSR